MDELLKYKQVGNDYNFPDGTLYSLVHRHQIPHIRLAKRLVRFRRSEIEEWIRKNSVAAGPLKVPERSNTYNTPGLQGGQGGEPQ